MRDYLQAENDLALAEAHSKAAFELFTHRSANPEERRAAEKEHTRAKARKQELEATVEQLRGQHRPEILRLNLLWRILEILDQVPGQ